VISSASSVWPASSVSIPPHAGTPIGLRQRVQGFDEGQRGLGLRSVPP
jgi:hypothetical protein